jgi:ribonucleoside-diphosphate reductase beta chain
MRKRNLLPGLGKANQFIARDEGLHATFACYLYRNILKNKLSPERVKEIVDDATTLEIEFATVSLPVRLIGINSEMMIEYIKYIADHLMISLGYQKIHSAKNPFPWMETMSLHVKSNFFEDDETNYQKAGVLQSKESEKLVEKIDF